MNKHRHVFLISCSDAQGLIHKVTGVLLEFRLNIVENNEFVDLQKQLFYMRTEVEGEFNSAQVLEKLRSVLPAGAGIEVKTTEPKKLLLFATKEAHCLGDLLLRHESGELNATILGVISQYDSLEKLVSRFDLPFVCVPVEGTNREQHENALLDQIERFNPDLLVLAKYMRILSAEFVSGFKHRIINIHHSFLPAFIGKNPYAQAYERGVKIIGATAHFVNENLDEGPIITQAVIPINHTQNARDLAKAGKEVEKLVLAKALGLVLENRVIVQGARTLVFE